MPCWSSKKETSEQITLFVQMYTDSKYIFILTLASFFFFFFFAGLYEIK